MAMAATLVLLIVGLVILAKGSDLFIDGAAYIARRFGITEFIVGLTLVSVGTSLPELGASVYASYYGRGAMAVGNIIGSNIANIALILGISIMLRNIRTTRVMLVRDGCIMLAVSFLFAGIAIGGISRLDGLILITCFFMYMRLLYMQRQAGDHTTDSGSPTATEDKLFKELIKLAAGGVSVFLGAKLLVDSAIAIATVLGVSEGVIGVTLVAFGTSAPELVVSIAAIKKGYGDIAIGNILGSNIFNVLLVGGVASLVRPLPVDDVLIRFNMPVMLFLATLLLIFMRTKWKLERWEGVVFVTMYIGFIVFNF